MAFSLLAFKSDALAADITDSANSMTLTTGSFGTPTGEQMLVIDYNIAAKREIVKCAIDGTAVTSIDRAQDGTAAVAHTSGAKIIMAFVPSHYTGLTDGTALTAGAITDTKLATKVKAGWDLLSATGTRASATQFTVTGDITDRLWVGKPLELTDTTTKYFNVTSFSYSSPNTTINFTGGTDYVLEGNPTNIYGGLHASPVGFPILNWTTTVANITKGSGTETGKFWMNGRVCHFIWKFVFASDSSMGTSPTITLPIPADITYNFDGSIIGEGTVLDATTALYPIQVGWTTGVTYGLKLLNASGTFLTAPGSITSSAPMTWTTNDTIFIKGSYLV
jgi:hypothetical protein